ncbi:MAG: carboxypeptidase-like regulatory domain-containing protein, partial [Terracidiphilus sp.]
MTKSSIFYPQRILAAWALTAIFAMIAGGTAMAQSAGTGTINGTIADSNQAAIPGAAVTLIDVDTGVSHDYRSDSAGLYHAPFLLPGHYEVTATASGFGNVKETGITLLVGQTLTINLTLTVSAASTTVEVSGTNEILDTEKTEVSQVLDTNLIANLPVNARNWSDFVLLTP